MLVKLFFKVISVRFLLKDCVITGVQSFLLLRLWLHRTSDCLFRWVETATLFSSSVWFSHSNRFTLSRHLLRRTDHRRLTAAVAPPPPPPPLYYNNISVDDLMVSVNVAWPLVITVYENFVVDEV